MQFSAFNAFCPFEIGDSIKDTTGHVFVITDIAAIHFVKSQRVEFSYELDNSGQYRKLQMAEKEKAL